MQVLVLIASHVESGAVPALTTGDRAAVHWGVTWGGVDCHVRFPAGDHTAGAYAAAVGAAGAVWDHAPMSTPNLVLIGPGMIEAFGDVLAGQLAEQYSAELLFDGWQVQRTGAHWRIVCDAGRGARDVLLVSGPVVVVLSDQVERPPYVSRFRLTTAARSLPESGSAPFSVPAWQPITPRAPRATGTSDLDAEQRTRLAFGLDAGSGHSAGKQVISAPPARCAQILLRYLVRHGWISRALPDMLEQPADPVDLHRAETVEPIAASSSLIATPVGPLQRAPRRLSAGVAAGSRGPFRLSQGR